MFNELLENVMNLGIITADDVKRLTAIELMLLIIERTNGLLTYVKDIDGNLENITLKQLNEWLADGTLEELINETALKNIDTKVDDLINQLTPSYGKLKGANIYIPYNTLNGEFTELLQQLKNTNCDTVCICPVLWMSSHTSDVVGYKAGTNKTDILLKVKTAKEQGFKVVLKPHVGGDGFTGYSSIQPANITTWLESYQQYLIELATTCKGYVDIFCVGNELNNQTKQQPATWKTIISNLRTIDNKMLISHANHSNEIETNVFLSELDLIGVNVYPPVMGNLSTNIELQRASLLTKTDELNRVINCAVKYGKEILITECGILPFEESLQAPSAWGFSSTPSENEEAQVRYYQLAIKELINANKIKGVMVWNACDGFTFVNRKAQATLKEIFGGEING